jgi:hypothetical protein
MRWTALPKSRNTFAAGMHDRVQYRSSRLLALGAWQGPPRPRRKRLPPTFASLQAVPREAVLRLRFALPFGTRQQPLTEG